MPTPFMHLALAQRLHHDPTLPDETHELLDGVWGAFLLGSIAPDARVSTGIARAETHFYEYRPRLEPPPVIEMLRRYPELRRESLIDPEHVSFIAGYVGHLKMDQVWCEQMLFPYFVMRSHSADDSQHQMMRTFHILMAHLDRRDRDSLVPDNYEVLCQTIPNHWLRFISDPDLCGWRDIVASQLAPGAQSRSFEILGKAAGMSPKELRWAVDHQLDQVWMQVSPEVLNAIETEMFTQARAAVIHYLTGV